MARRNQVDPMSKSATATPARRYIIVFQDEEIGLHQIELTDDNIISALEVRGHGWAGTNRNPAHRAELQGRPKFHGLAGPMYGGPGVVRYETIAAYRTLSA